MLAQVGGFDRRLDSPRLGLSTVRRAQAATPVIRITLRRRHSNTREASEQEPSNRRAKGATPVIRINFADIQQYRDMQETLKQKQR